MLAPRTLPAEYQRWNARYGAPFGFRSAGSFKNRILKKLGLTDVAYRWDPFSYQTNSSTRAFEYPWAFEQLRNLPGKVLEIGGGLSGLQFVLSHLGSEVVNVDPGQPEKRDCWHYEGTTFERLNKKFGTSVELRSTTIDQAGLRENSFDYACCISVLEHLPPAATSTIMNHVWRCLKPGGRFVLTVDLFLNLAPFCGRQENEFGTNMNIAWLLGQSPFAIETGDRSELFGYDEFVVDRILSSLEQYLIGTCYPVLTQCLVLRKLH